MGWMIRATKERLISLLRQSEPYMKTDMVYLASGGFWLTIAMAVSMLGGFGLALAFGNLVPKEVFGNYKFVFSLAGLFGTVALTSIGTAVTRALEAAHPVTPPGGGATLGRVPDWLKGGLKHPMAAAAAMTLGIRFGQDAYKLRSGEMGAEEFKRRAFISGFDGSAGAPRRATAPLC